MVSLSTLIGQACNSPDPLIGLFLLVEEFDGTRYHSDCFPFIIVESDIFMPFVVFLFFLLVLEEAPNPIA